jgi:organic radical activating enzyme
MSKDRYFPIKTDTGCRLKWSWSTLYLNSGSTASCHRASHSVLDSTTFDNFHNTKEKIQARKLMLDGQWPTDGCEYCKSIEDAGGISDRQFQNKIPNIYPVVLDDDPTTTVVDPTILEIFFSNTCNLKCVYCTANLSSSIQSENKKFNGSIIKSNNFEYVDNQYQQLVPKFWNWFNANSQTLKRLQVLGGEPFLQSEVNQLIDYFEINPHPDLEFNIVTNLSLPTAVIKKPLQQLSNLVKSNKLKRVDIQVSIDAWSTGQEYIRHGLNLSRFDENMKLLMEIGSFRIGLLSTVSSLSIPTMVELLHKRNEWNQTQEIFWYMHLVLPHGETIFSPTNFDYSMFEKHLTHIEDLLPGNTWDDNTTKEIFLGIMLTLKQNCQTNIIKQKELLEYLEENDRRRNTKWQQAFPWLVQELTNVV